MHSQSVEHVSECFIKPSPFPEKAKQPYYLGPFDLAMLSVHYIQKGLLFKKPAVANDQENPTEVLVQKLKESLSVTLTHFYPLAGRLATKKEESPHSYVVFIDCVNSPGARFVQSKVDLTISDVLSPTYVPLVVQSFFDHDRAINHDGHKLSLLTIQVTELKDGVFIACSLDHSVADGTSYWHFFNTLSEVFMRDNRNKVSEISRPPVHERWFPDGYGPVFSLPFTHSDQFISRHDAPELKERIFHFSAAALARIKAKANAKCKDENTHHCHRITSETVFRQAVAEYDDKASRKYIADWLHSPFVYQLGQFFDPCSVMMGSSPRFDMYGNEFGLGKAVAVLSGYANKFNGKVTLYPGHEGGGSMDLEICLPLQFMTALECDEELLDGLNLSG
ncbi:N-hydroxycinnamoyl/benzoyltransferase 6 [Heracleum sosnowskyi]|uniref:N-hydroxycinnamoyl/benzoyltransferase 6 n=1 Tax=Heracleum sosnowskyi TaxID=360622 RepID=A0AAD8IYF7_9APIA|nr:N-hydroxycinnamoyl/benzoyltransferase 6 [Heracleum sosnowskyi]